MSSYLDRALDFLAARSRAYRLTYLRPNVEHMARHSWRIRLLHLIPAVRCAAYRAVFPEAWEHSIVLRDICVFGRVFESCVIPGDPDRSLLLAGRREMALRHIEHMHLSVDQLYRLYGGVQPLPKAEDKAA